MKANKGGTTRLRTRPLANALGRVFYLNSASFGRENKDEKEWINQSYYDDVSDGNAA